MKKQLIYCWVVLCLCGVLLAGCSSEPFVVGEIGSPKPVEAVEIFYIDRPDCEFETIAHLVMETPYFSLQGAVNAMRTQAAELGAEGLFVEQTQRLPGRDYVATGRAIKCISEDQV